MLSVPDEADEKRVRCPSCGNVFSPEYSFDPEIFFLEHGMPKERAWVGEIVDLVENSLNEWKLANLADWTVYIDRTFNSPVLESSSDGAKKKGVKHSTLGQCQKFSVFLYALENRMDTQRFVQEMAFELCKIIEPNWDELIQQRWD